MTALKCILWRRPRKYTLWRQPTMSLAPQSNLQRKSKIRSKQCLKQWCKSRRGNHRPFAAVSENREMPCLEPTAGSDGHVIPTSPEMPILLPFTTEHEDPVFNKIQEEDSVSHHQVVRVIKGEKELCQPVVLLKRLMSLSVDDVRTEESVADEERIMSPLSLDGYSYREDWVQWPGEYEGCSCEDIVVAPTENSFFPEIDVIDGVEFLSFLQEDDMNDYAQTHSHSLVFGDIMQESPSLSADDFSEDKVRGIIFPTKTKDITQIKGWKRKTFAEEPELNDFIGSSPESPSWMQDESVATEDVVLLDKSPVRPICNRTGAFVSSSLDDFLKTSSQLRINYLTSYIPSIAPIPSDSPILSVGTLTKENISSTTASKPHQDTKTRMEYCCAEDQLRSESCTLTSAKVKTEKDDSFFRTSPKCNPNLGENAALLSPVTSASFWKNEESFVKEEEEITSNCKMSPSQRSDKYHRLIHETVIEDEKDHQKIADFLTSLRSPSAYSSSRLSFEKQKAILDFPTVTEHLARDCTTALYRTVTPKVTEHQIPLVVKNKRGRKRKHQFDVPIQPVACGEMKSPEKRNKRMIRLPIRFLDSALIVPGSEGWVSPNLSHSDIGKKQNSPKSQPQDDVTNIKTRSGKTDSLLNERFSSYQRTGNGHLSKADNCRTSLDSTNKVAPKEKPTVTYLKLKHLSDEGTNGISSVQSLLIIHPSLSMHETSNESTVNLPLAAMALPSVSYNESKSNGNPLVYLLYGSSEVVHQYQTSSLETKSLDKLLQGASPIVPVLRSISANVDLHKLPFRAQALLEAKSLTLFVYPVAVGTKKPEVTTPNSHPESPTTRSQLKTVSSFKEISPQTESLSNIKFYNNPAQNCESKRRLVPKGNPFGFNGKLKEISSLQVTKDKIIMKPSTCSNFVGRSDSSVGLDTSADNSKERETPLHNGLSTQNDSVLRKELNAKEAITWRKNCKKHFHNLYKTIFRSTKENEKLSDIGLLKKATEHILSLCGEDKQLREEKARLHAANSRLITAYMQRLETLPLDVQRKAVGHLSQQMDVPSRDGTRSPRLQINKSYESKDIHDMEKVAKAACKLVGPCSVRRVSLRNGHTVYVYSAHNDEANGDTKEGAEETALELPLPRKQEEEDKEKKKVIQNNNRRMTSLWVSDMGEPCFVTQLVPDEDPTPDDGKR